MWVMPDLMARRPTPTAASAVASLQRIGVDPDRIEQIPVSPLESFKGGVVGQVPHPGTAIDERTQVVLYVARDGLAERLPHAFLEPLPTTEDEAHVAIEPGQIMEFWERQVASYKPGRRFITVIDRALSRLDTALGRIEFDLSPLGQDVSFARRILDLVGYGELPLTDEEVFFLAGRMQSLYARFGVLGGMTHLLEGFLGIRVDVVELDGGWRELPASMQRSLGASDALLGQRTVMGPRFRDPKPQIRVDLGPVRAAEHAALDCDERWRKRVHDLVEAMVPADTEWSTRLLLDERDHGMPLGDRLLGRLGRSSWIAAEA